MFNGGARSCLAVSLFGHTVSKVAGSAPSVCGVVGFAVWVYNFAFTVLYEIPWIAGSTVMLGIML